MTAAEKILDEAMSLPADLRASLVENLLRSLNLPTQQEIENLWAEEAERRASQIEGGTVKLVPGEEVFSKIRARYPR